MSADKISNIPDREYRRGDAAYWDIPLVAGEYVVRLVAKPLKFYSNQTNVARVNVHFGIVTKSGEIIEIAQNTPGADFGGGPLPSRFTHAEATLKFATDITGIFIQVDGIYDHQDFFNGDAGWISEIHFEEMHIAPKK